MGKIKIGIFGANGFIGKSLIEYLKKCDEIEFIIFTGNLLDKNEIDIFFVNNKNIDQIINLVGSFFGDFNELFDSNLVTVNNLLDIMVKFNIKKIIHASTGAVYGEPTNKISKENDLLKPNTLYGLTKMYGEECIKYYSRKNTLKYIILRFPNVYGPTNKKGVIFNFIKSIKDNGEINLLGDGEQKRNFLYIDDAVESIIRSIHYKGDNKIFNIADTNLYSVNDVIRKLKGNNLKFNIKYGSENENNKLKVLSENIELAINELKWMPVVKFDEGLKIVINYYIKN